MPSHGEGFVPERYEFLEPLGSGGMGHVALVRDRRTLARCALKRMLPRPGVTTDRFEREASAAMRLDHPYIARVVDWGWDRLGPYIAMEFVEGENLHKRAKRNKLTEREVKMLFDQLCAAVEHAHGRGVIHRDIKPSNVIVKPDGNVKLVDFGLAKTDDGASLSMSGAGFGTADYAAPEQRRDARNVDERADVYSLGATLYEMLTGIPPAPLHLLKLAPHWQQVVGKACEPDRNERFASVRELRDAVRNAGAAVEAAASGENSDEFESWYEDACNIARGNDREQWIVTAVRQAAARARANDLAGAARHLQSVRQTLVAQRHFQRFDNDIWVFVDIVNNIRNLASVEDTPEEYERLMEARPAAGYDAELSKSDREFWYGNADEQVGGRIEFGDALTPSVAKDLPDAAVASPSGSSKPAHPPQTKQDREYANSLFNLVAYVVVVALIGAGVWLVSKCSPNEEEARRARFEQQMGRVEGSLAAAQTPDQIDAALKLLDDVPDHASLANYQVERIHDLQRKAKEQRLAKLREYDDLARDPSYLHRKVGRSCKWRTVTLNPRRERVETIEVKSIDGDRAWLETTVSRAGQPFFRETRSVQIRRPATPDEDSSYPLGTFAGDLTVEAGLFCVYLVERGFDDTTTSEQVFKRRTWYAYQYPGLIVRQTEAGRQGEEISNQELIEYVD